MSAEFEDLVQLARMYGVEASYLDVDDVEQHASVDTLRAVLTALGREVDGSTDLAAARRERKQQHLERVLEPVDTLMANATLVRVPPGCDRFECLLRTEEGLEEAWTVEVDEADVRRRDTLDGRKSGGDVYRTIRVVLPNPVPHGYHSLRVKVGGRWHESMLIAAPETMWSSGETRTRWGVFLPMYATHGERSWGRGDFTDFGELLAWSGERGADFVGTLPLLANEWEHDIDPSPYAPTSRRFWNEFHLDPRRCPEFATSEDARELVGSAEFVADIDAARASRLVDYERLVPLHRTVVEHLARAFFRSDADRRGELTKWLKQHPEADLFARYRARGESEQGRWPTWTEEPTSGDETFDLDARAYQYHVYAQWQTWCQLAELDGRGASLYLDFPLGVRRDGYDVWRDPEAFGLTASGGAPPDSFFTKGQDWGFPPPHPEGIREARYGPWIEGIRAHLRVAKLLRIDHAMGLYRLFWVPQGMTAREGAYVRYAERELFAILALESHRHEAVLVGENLGTCPPTVDEAMDRHAMSGMYVVEFEIDVENEEATLNPVPADTMASLNTHDLPTFAAFWNGLDIDDHLDLGLYDETEAAEARAGRERMRAAVSAYLAGEGFLEAASTQDDSTVLAACLRWLVAQGPRYVLVNLEDTWGETEPQNVPGTWRERPNWQRRSRRSLEELRADEHVRALLASIAAKAADLRE